MGRGKGMRLTPGVSKSVQSETLVQGRLSWVKEASGCSHWIVEHGKKNVRTCSEWAVFNKGREAIGIPWVFSGEASMGHRVKRPAVETE